jgi:dephospho-CoA kinase
VSAAKRPAENKMLVVLTGPMAAGKGSVEKWARARNIPFVSMSELIEEHAGMQKEEIGREGMQDFANGQRHAHGADLYARRIAERIGTIDSSLIIVDGMRNLHECEYFRTHFQTIVVGIVPESPEQEFQNVRKRRREGDPQTREQFERARQRELGHGEGEEGQHVAACVDAADVVIVHGGGEGDGAKLVERFEAILSERGIEAQR